MLIISLTRYRLGKLSWLLSKKLALGQKNDFWKQNFFKVDCNNFKKLGSDPITPLRLRSNVK